MSTAIPIKNSGVEELDNKKRNVILLTPETVSSNFTIKGNKEFTGLDGKYVHVDDTVQGFKEILEGKYDDLPEQAFHNVGTIEDVKAKAETLK